MTCLKVAPLVDRLLVAGRVPGWRFRRMWRHLATCGTCRAYFDRAAVAWRAMGPGAEPPQIAEARADEVVARVGAPKRRPSRWRLGAWTVAGAGALAALAVAARVAWPPHGPDRSTFVERGTAAARARGIRAFCLDVARPEAVAVRGDAASARPDVASPVLACRAGDDLQLAYTLGAGAGEDLVVIARSADGRRVLLEPAPNAARSTALRPGALDEPLAERVHLRALGAPGRYTIEALFLSAPLDAMALDALAARGADPGRGVIDRQQLALDLAP